MTNPAHAAALARVAKLLPSLARENDPEVVTTARAIVRTLETAGLDLHSLAALILGSGQASKPAPAAPPKRKPDWPEHFSPPPRPRFHRNDPNREDLARSYAFGGGSFTAFGVSDALRREIKPHRKLLDPEDGKLFDMIDARLESGGLLVPQVHAQLLDIAIKLRGTV